MNERKSCEYCQNIFTPQRKTARFCCDSCRTQSYLQKKRDRERQERIKKGLPVRMRGRDRKGETEAERLERLRGAVDRLPR